MMKKNVEKDVIIKLYEESLNDLMWTHKIQATLLDEYTKKNKRLKTTMLIKDFILPVTIANIVAKW